MFLRRKHTEKHFFCNLMLSSTEIRNLLRSKEQFFFFFLLYIVGILFAKLQLIVQNHQHRPIEIFLICRHSNKGKFRLKYKTRRFAGLLIALLIIHKERKKMMCIN